MRFSRRFLVCFYVCSRVFQGFLSFLSDLFRFCQGFSGSRGVCSRVLF